MPNYIHNQISDRLPARGEMFRYLYAAISTYEILCAVFCFHDLPRHGHHNCAFVFCHRHPPYSIVKVFVSEVLHLRYQLIIKPHPVITVGAKLSFLADAEQTIAYIAKVIRTGLAKAKDQVLRHGLYQSYAHRQSVVQALHMVFRQTPDELAQSALVHGSELL
jgi:hypothetical protein